MSTHRLDPNDPVLHRRHRPSHPLLDPGCGAWRDLLRDVAERHAIWRPPGEELETLRRVEHTRMRGVRSLEVGEVLTALRARHLLGEPVEQWTVADSEHLVRALMEDGGVWPLSLAGDTLLEYGGDVELEAATGEEHIEPQSIGRAIGRGTPLHLRLHPHLRGLVARHGHPSPQRGRIHIKWTTRTTGYPPLERLLDAMESAPVHATAVIRTLCWTDAALAEWRMVLSTTM